MVDLFSALRAASGDPPGFPQLAIRIADGKVPDENSYWDTKPHSLIQRSCPWWCRAGSDPTMPSNAHACGFKLANDGHDTRALQHYLGHKNIQHTVRYTEMAPDRFKDFWRG